jgi:hypothetical protein
MDQFSEQLPKRIVQAQRDEAQRDYAIFVYCTRHRLEMDRDTLAKKAKIAKHWLTCLENELLQPDELGEDARRKVEAALGISYCAFRRANQGHWDELRRCWQVRRSLGEAPDPRWSDRNGPRTSSSRRFYLEGCLYVPSLLLWIFHRIRVRFVSEKMLTKDERKVYYEVR